MLEVFLDIKSLTRLGITIPKSLQTVSSQVVFFSLIFFCFLWVFYIFTSNSTTIDSIKNLCLLTIQHYKISPNILSLFTTGTKVQVLQTKTWVLHWEVLQKPRIDSRRSVYVGDANHRMCIGNISARNICVDLG